MRLSSLLFAVAAVIGSGSAALAYENYIPLGTGYSANVESLPSFDSVEGQVSQQADVYETEIYMLGRKRVEEESRFRSFFSDAESTGSDTNIDY